MMHVLAKAFIKSPGNAWAGHKSRDRPCNIATVTVHITYMKLSAKTLLSLVEIGLHKLLTQTTTLVCRYVFKTIVICTAI